MGSESIAHEAKGWMGYWLRGHEGKRNDCFSKMQLVGQTNIKRKRLSLVEATQNVIQLPLFWFSNAALFSTRRL